VKKTAYLLLADGFEEIEAVTPVDLLRRAGVEVSIVGVGEREATGNHGVRVVADCRLGDLGDGLADAVILPGGMPGAKTLGATDAVRDLCRRHAEAGRIVAALCAAPGMALAPFGLLDGRQATCYPGFEEHFPESATHVAERVVVDGNIITSRGPGTAFDFALAIVTTLAGQETAREIAAGTQYTA